MTTVDDDGSSVQPLPTRVVRRRSRSNKGQIRRRIMITAAFVILGLLLVCGAAGGVLARQASEVKNQLEQAMSLVPQLRVELGEGRYADAQQTLGRMQGQISDARATSTGPLWKAASAIPIAGPNFRAVSEVAVSADDVAGRAVAPLLKNYDSLDWDALSPKDGRIDVSPLEEASPTITAAANTVRLSYERMAAINLSSLLPEIAAPIGSATEQLREFSKTLGSASAVGRLLPSMMGTENPRNFLLLVQNNAETRATGGIPGALAIVSTDNGRMTMGAQSSASNLGVFNPPLDVDAEQEALYTPRLGTQMQNVNLTPEFPTVASTAKRMWEDRHNGESVDGVIALDPVVLGHLLDATGPVVLTDPVVLDLIQDTTLPKSLTKDNVVSTLLSDVYREIDDPAAQDVYFAAVAGQVFAAFTNGQGDGADLIRALSTSVDENRLYLWSSDSDEQDIIVSTALAGSVVGTQAGGASFGAYFNDGTGAKMDYYTARTAQLLKACPAGAYNAYTVRLTTENTAPTDAGSSLPNYVTGGGMFGVMPGHVRTNYVFYGPAQSFVETAMVNGKSVPVGAGKHGQRPVGTVTVELAPGETAVVEIAFSRVVQDSEPSLRVSPGLESPNKVVLPTKQMSCG